MQAAALTTETNWPGIHLALFTGDDAKAELPLELGKRATLAACCVPCALEGPTCQKHNGALIKVYYRGALEVKSPAQSTGICGALTPSLITITIQAQESTSPRVLSYSLEIMVTVSSTMNVCGSCHCQHWRWTQL